MASPLFFGCGCLLLWIAFLESVFGARASPAGLSNYSPQSFPRVLPGYTVPSIASPDSARDSRNAQAFQNISTESNAANNTEPGHAEAVPSQTLRVPPGVENAPGPSLSHPRESHESSDSPSWLLTESRPMGSIDAERSKEAEEVGSPKEQTETREAFQPGKNHDAASKQLARVSQLKQVQAIIKRIEQLAQQPQENPSPSTLLDQGPVMEQQAGVSSLHNYNDYVDQQIPNSRNQSDVSRSNHLSIRWNDEAPMYPNATESDSFYNNTSMPYILPLYNSSFTESLPYSNISQTVPSPTEDPELPALTDYYIQLGDVRPVYFLVGNTTPPLNDTIGINTVTQFFQDIFDQETRDRIVAFTPPRVFGRLEELFWGTAERVWRQWVDIWRNYKRSPPYAIGVKREEADGYQRIYNEFANWAYDLPFYIYDSLFNNTVFYLYPVLIARSDAIARRDELLLRSMEKQAIFYAPIFYSSRTILQVCLDLWGEIPLSFVEKKQ